jgi:hypothetical protein
MIRFGESDDDTEEIEEATWEEFSQFDKESFRFLTFSEFDQFEETSVFCYEQNVPEYCALERDFVPLNFLSNLSINTRKGNKLKIFTCAEFSTNFSFSQP